MLMNKREGLTKSPMTYAIQSGKPNALVHKIPVSFAFQMKAEIEKESDILGISEQGFIRMCVRLYFKGGGLKASELPSKEDP